MAETIEITVNNKKNLHKLTAQLRNMPFVQEIKKKNSDTSVLAEKSFSEEWNSEEDSRWDNLL